MDLSLFYGEVTCINVSRKKPEACISDADLGEAVAVLEE
jgi:hypothetical protein